MESQISGGRAKTLLEKLEISDKLRVTLPEQKDTKRRTPILVALATVGCLTGLLVASLTIDKVEDFKVWDLEAWRWCGFIFTFVMGGLVARLFLDLTIFCLDFGIDRLKNQIAKKKLIKERSYECDPNVGDDNCVVGIKGALENNEFKDKEDRLLRLKERVLEEGYRVAYVVSGSRGSIQAFIWLVFILIAWILLLRNGVKLSKRRVEELNKVNRGLVASLLSFGLWMVKCILLQCLGYSFIVERSKRKIKEAEEEQEKLKDLWKMVQSLSNEEIPETHEGSKVKVLKDELGLIEIDRCWTPKRLIWRVVGRELPLIVEDEDEIDTIECAARVTGERLFGEISKALGVAKASNHKSQTKYIIVPKPLNQQQALLFEKFEKVTPQVKSINKVQRFRRSDLEDWVAHVYIDRIVLLRTINGRDNVLCELNRIDSLITLVVILVVWLLVMGLLTTGVMIAIAGQIVAFSFMFNNTAKTVFEAFFFVFVTRPFDVGDRCRVGSDEHQMVVHDMNMLSTIFRKLDGEKVYYPNSVLMDKSISNYYTVPDTCDTIEFTVKADTLKDDIITPNQPAGDAPPKANIQKLQDKINEYLANESKNWQPECNLVIDDEIDKQGNIQSVILSVKHSVNFYNGGDRRKHRDDLISELPNMLKKLKIVSPELSEPGKD